MASGVKSVMLDGREIQMVNGAYQIPAMSGSLITSGNPLTYTVTAVDYAGNESEINNTYPGVSEAPLDDCRQQGKNNLQQGV